MTSDDIRKPITIVVLFVALVAALAGAGRLWPAAAANWPGRQFEPRRAHAGGTAGRAGHSARGRPGQPGSGGQGRSGPGCSMRP